MSLPFQLAALGMAVAMLAPTARAAADAALFSSDNAVGSARLDDCRGGFTTTDGLVLSIGIDRLVTVNGNIVERSSSQVAGIEGLASVAGLSAGNVRLIPNGDNNAVLAPLTTALSGTVIQNSLNDQLISTQTTISATVNSAGLLQALNFQASLSNALTNAVGK